jgi:hypothetical protein
MSPEIVGGPVTLPTEACEEMATSINNKASFSGLSSCKQFNFKGLSIIQRETLRQSIVQKIMMSSDPLADSEVKDDLLLTTD